MTLALIGLLGCVSVARSSCNRYICVFLFVGGRLIVVLSVKLFIFWFFVFSLRRGRRPRPLCCVVGYIGIVEVYNLCGSCAYYVVVGGCYTCRGF